MYMKLTMINYTVLNCGWRIASVVITCMYTWKISYVYKIEDEQLYSNFHTYFIIISL